MGNLEGESDRTILKHVIKRIRSYWPRVRVLVRGDSHYARREAMDWCEDNGVDYIFGLAGNDVVRARVRGAADDLCVRRAEAGADKLRGFRAFDYAAKSWRRKRHVVARLEASARGFDTRFVVTSLTLLSA